MKYKNNRSFFFITLLIALIFSCSGLSAEGYTNTVFGGTDSVSSQLEEDAKIKKPALRFEEIDEYLLPWFNWKKEVDKSYAFKIGTDYTTLYQHSNDALSNEKAAFSGVFRLFGKWTLLGRGTENTGDFIFKIEHRHRIDTDKVPGNFAGSIGYLGVSGTSYTDDNLVLNDFAWNQKFNNGQWGFMIGRYDPNNYMDVSGHANPWTTFSNLSILFNTSMVLPSTSWGVGAGSWIENQWYVVGTLSDLNGNLADLDFFKDGGEFYKAIEIGWSPSPQERYLTNAHITYWHVDERGSQAIPKSDGIGISANMILAYNWMIFSRLGWSDGPAPLMQKAITVGFHHRSNENSDKYGLGLNWGDPTNKALNEQTTAELFYRWQLSKNIAVTPSIQWIKNPALNPVSDEVVLMGLRARIAL